MQDILETSRIFEASSKLQSTASLLVKIAEKQDLSEGEANLLVWSGRFLSEVDWSFSDKTKEDTSGSFALQATAIRPTFYSSLISTASHFRNAGLKSEQQIANFLHKVYKLLLQGGVVAETESKLTKRELKLAHDFFSGMSRNLLIQLNRNGVSTHNDISTSDLMIA